jgi:alpha-tubulin suppressor-like RCC1 family protein
MNPTTMTQASRFRARFQAALQALLLLCFFAALPASAQQSLGSVAKLSAGDLHTCAVLPAGNVKCWGSNTFNQLGDAYSGLVFPSSIPALEVFGVVPAVSIAAGRYHNCAVTTQGAVNCWGRNNSGQSGMAASFSVWGYATVSGLTGGATAVAAGENHTCALKSNGDVVCWGSNAEGQLGDTSSGARHVPGVVSGLGNVAAIAAGYNATCALTQAGGVKCWGSNTNGQLGDGTTTSRYQPADVPGLTSGVSAITGGIGHFCALTTTGAVKCWGANEGGQLGDGSFTQRETPVDAFGLNTGVTLLSAGMRHTCAAVNGNALKCWGNNIWSQLGERSLLNRNFPTDAVLPAGNITALAAGSGHSCAMIEGQGVQCWGANNVDQLGQNTSVVSYIPVPVALLSSGVAKIDTGITQSCALTTAGGVKCWGNNILGGVGDGTFLRADSPVDVVGLTSGVTAISVGGSHACALTSAGGVKCWGNNTDGQLGDGSAADRSGVPVDVSGLTSGVAAIGVGTSYSCAVLSTGALKCWGLNTSGQLGDNSTVSKRTPTDVSGLAGGVAAVAAGTIHTCALMTSGGVQCWGMNNFGFVGDGTTTQRLVPTQVSGLTSGVTQISAGTNQTCAIAGAGTLLCWGFNSQNRLAIGAGNGIVPAPVSGMGSGVMTVSSGSSHVCAVAAGNVAKCWGSSSSGQVSGGGGTVTAPRDVSLPPAMDIAAGSAQSCAVTTAGRAYCWGSNAASALGTGGFPGSVWPVAVSQYDTDPDPFTFASQADVPLASVRTSAAVTISGLFTDGSIWIENGEFSIGCTSAFLSQAYLVANNQTVCVRHTSAATPGHSVVTTLHVGSVSVTFTSTTATQGLPTTTLGVTKIGAGTGSVTSSVPGIDCGADCSETFPIGQQLTLTATPDAGSSFGGWQGVNCRGGNAQNVCTILLKAALTAKATFHSGAGFARTRIAAGYGASLVVGADGSFQSWGAAERNGVGVARSLPGLVDANTNWADVAAGNTASAAIKADGTLWTWGDNAYCQLGGGPTTPAVTLPTQRVAGSDWSKVSVGPYHMLALRSDGTLWGWGLNSAKQVDFNGGYSVCLTQANADTDWIAVAAGSSYSMGIKADGSLWHWGRVIAPTGDTLQPPTRIGTANDWAAVSAGPYNHALFLKQDGSLWALGGNNIGQLGDGTLTFRTELVRIGAENDWAQINATDMSSFAIKTDGSLWSWGSNDQGILGHGTYSPVQVPTRVGSANHWTSVSSTLQHALALSADGTLWAWGNNFFGQVGTGNPGNTARVPAIVGKYAPTVSLVQSPLPANAGDSVTVTATVQGNSATATGTVTFSAAYAPVAACTNVPLVSGVASCTLNSFTAAMQPVSAAYSGDANYNPADSGAITLLLGPFRINVTKSGSGSGTITSQAAGIECGATCTADFPYNEVVRLTAVAAPGSRFASWSQGSCLGNPFVDICDVRVDRIKNVNVAFALERTLDVSVGGGGGTVTGLGIDCPGDCSEVRTHGSTTTYTATPAAGAIFMGWSGACTGMSLTCSVTMDANKTLTATFGYGLSINKGASDNGSVAVSFGGFNCTSSWCDFAIPANTEVTLTATPSAGWVFDGWSGACSGTGTCTVTMNQARSVTAAFKGASSVTLVTTGSGYGDVNPRPQFFCGMSCSANYPTGTVLTFTATPNSGSVFTSWIGCDTVSGNQCTLTANGARTVTVTFDLENGQIARNDFNDDGRADILLRNLNTGENYLYPMNGSLILASEGYIRSVPDPWTLAGIGDFDGNGTADLFWRNTSNGDNYIYFMNGTTITNEGYFRTVPLAWSVAGVADFDGDGKADILLRNLGTGENYLYPMNGLNIKGTEGYIRTIPAPWVIAGLADFDGDAKADMLLRNPTTGENYLYPMDGTSIKGTEGYIRTVPLAWDIAGLGDFDGDGKADILLRNPTTGENYLYPMDGTSIKGTEGYIRTVPLAWAIASIADFDGDGKVDILLRNTSTGENYLYPMDGTSIKGTEGYIRTVPLQWSVVSK